MHLYAIHVNLCTKFMLLMYMFHIDMHICSFLYEIETTYSNEKGKHKHFKVSTLFYY